MKYPDRIISGSKIRNQLWDFDAEPMSNVVAAQMRLIRRKLVSYNCICPIETIRGQGYSQFILTKPMIKKNLN